MEVTKIKTGRQKSMEAEKLIEALHTVEKLKRTMRHCYTSDDRKESVAEHCWRVALMAYWMEDEFSEVDINKVIKMCLIHDLGECFTGDIPCFKKTEADEETEENLLYQWVATLPEPLNDKMRTLYQEMSELKTLEAKIYKALDNMEGALSHNESDLKTWEPHEYELTKNYGIDKSQFHPYIKHLRECIRQETVDKIIAAGRNITLAEESDKDELLKLYRSMIGGAADWNEYYPSMENIEFDIAHDSLFVMKNQKGEIISAISIDHDEEVDKLDCWSKDFQPSAEVARVCVRKDLQGQGIAKMMMEHVFTVLREQNKKSVHILVRDNHKVALKCYSDLGFVPVGECELFEKHFVCMEKSL